MIVFRYLSKELLSSWLAISGILLLVIVSGRFIKYLEQAALGELKAQFLFSIMGYRLPGFLEMIMPLALFIGILLVYGRLYVDSEMTVLEACGISQHRLLGYTMIPALLVALIVALLSLWLAPAGADRVEDILHHQDSMTGLDTLTPGRFQTLNKGSSTSYVEALVQEKAVMNHVFIAHRSDPDQNGKQEITLLASEHGRLHLDSKSGKRYLMLTEGYRYDLTLGKPESRIMQYQTYGLQMQGRDANPRASKDSVRRTSELLDLNSNASKAELQWRLSLPLLTPVIVLMALPLARVDPRQGRFVKLLPGVLLYLMYLALLIAARGAVEDGNLSASIGLWGVHAVFLCIALLMFYQRRLMPLLPGRRR